MTQSSSEYPTELEGKTKFYLELIRRIDAILADPVKTLIRITDEYITKAEQLPKSNPLGFPVWMSDHLQPEPGDDLFSKAISFATLQEIGKLRRRFAWLTDSDSKALQRLLKPEQKPAGKRGGKERDQELAPNRLIQNLLPPPKSDLFRCVDSLSSTAFGALNPFTAAQVFQVLLRDSERYAHGTIGFLAFFAMIWPLHRRFPDAQKFGAAIEPWEPKAYVTAKCILPIKTLQDICSERAALMSETVSILTRLKESAKKEKRDPYQRWLFNVELDDLRTRLLRLSGIVVAKEKLRRRSEQVGDFADGLSQNLGYTLLTAEHLNASALAAKLRKSKDQLSVYIRGHCGRTLSNNNNGVNADALVNDLNRLLRGPCIFNKQRFARVKLSKEVQAFVDEKPRGDARIYLNRLLLRAAYPNEIRMNRPMGASIKTILQGAHKALQEIGCGGVAAFEEVNDLLKAIETNIVKPLQQPSETNIKQLTKKGLKFAREYTEHPEKRSAYFKDLHTAARESLGFCRRALKTLYREYRRCSRVKNNFDSIKRAASELAAANIRVAAMMEDLVRDATAWCGRVADREIAHASAQNLTDFDPSELVSAINVAVKWNQMTTTLQVSDAVDKALAGMRADGSWSSGQPFYSPNNAVGIWPITSDIVLTLTEALDEHPEVEVADAALFRYVDWLERTRTELPFPGKNQSKQKTDALAVGWSSDRFRNRRKIHFPTTAFSVNALLKIRDLVEHRLWQLCEKRFTVIKSRERSLLKKAAPVDLGAQHLYRLHRHLAWIAERQKRDFEHAEYSLVLHGPPGSSKTFIAKALSVEQWKAISPSGSKEEPRLVRITPADFTRMGEDRLDSEARVIFDLLSGVRGVTILFDEIDDLLRQRNTDAGPQAPKPTFMELVVPAMLNRLADLREACPRQEICVLLATNFIESIEPALLRRGRIDRLVPVVYPDQESRHALIIKFTGKPEFMERIERELKSTKNQVFKAINEHAADFAEELKGWPYLTIESACRKVLYDLDQLLKQMSGDAGSRLTPKQKTERFLLQVEDSIRQVVEEYKSSITTPNYGQRLVLPFRSELLDEYAHFIIAKTASGDDLEKWAKSDEPSHEPRSKEIYAKIKMVLENENRWPKDRKVRATLGKLANGSTVT